MESGIRSSALFLLFLGVSLATVPLVFQTGYTKGLGLGWNLRNMEVVFKDKVTAEYMRIGEFRRRYPIYGDMPDDELALKLHAKFFLEIPFAEYREAFIGASEPGSEKAYAGKNADPLGLEDEMEAPESYNPLLRAIAGMDAQNFGLVDYEKEKIAVPFLYTLAAGTLLALAGIVLLFRRRS